ncbi:MotA/TolQ/ExbB proton channel family protein [Pelagicoccus sp. SDUM812002]|uniref:MotA/TolQ/ExbB proton channel family protein n=1 Tax=Pelagicoccus sp. SDUM812002 TaxID=3041266 RepID=UPI00280F1449|nr:MotA/TolQ/ExbB proton channel family protein [Pelagicoccus sp. SDUM812002]MDQ8184796.1 MotA/TolQ/ExbB proton channel family protein [Pelagicoccus sp. SDUM812002]
MDALSSFVASLKSGGPVMYLLALLSYVLYWQVIAILLYVMKIRLHEFVGRDNLPSAKATGRSGLVTSPLELLLVRYEEVQMQFREFMKNRLRFAGVLLVAAPLLGLLGTVLGMLEMFNGLSQRAGHQTTLLVAEGVKKSLITTQTGLTIAIPALFFVYWIRRVANRRELELLDHKVAATEDSRFEDND